MHLSINPVEAVWTLLNFSTFLLTLSALVDARADQRAVKLLNGHARELAAAGIVRREFLRLVMQVLLLAVVIPGLFADGDTPVNYIVVILMSIPVLLLLSSLLDARDRRGMTVIVAADLALENASVQARMTAATGEILDAIAANTQLTQKTKDSADAAYHEANNVNEKIRLQGDQLLIQGEAIEAHHGEEAVALEQDTHEKVVEIHDKVVEGS